MIVRQKKLQNKRNNTRLILNKKYEVLIYGIFRK